MKLRYLRTFESFSMAEPKTKPNPGTSPSTTPDTDSPTKPQRPTRKSPFPRHKPAVDPRPKAELEDVMQLFYISAESEEFQKIKDYYDEKNND